MTTATVGRVVKWWPTIMTAESVRGIYAGTKTMTRRIVTDRNSVGNFKASELDLDRAWVDGSKLKAFLKPEVSARLGHDPDDVVERLYSPLSLDMDEHGNSITHRLWVRETWKYADWTEDGYPFIGYAADDSTRLCERHPDEWGDRLMEIWADLSEPENYAIDNRAADRRWRSPIHMPRWASRLTLEVTEVRVERLNEISYENMRAEGLPICHPCDPTTCFAELWNRLNAKRGYGWDKNPWVFVISFRVLSGRSASEGSETP